MRISDWSSDVCSSDLPYYPPAIFFECSIKIDVDAKFGEMIEIMAQKVPFGVAPVLDSQRTDQKITVVPPWPTPSHYLPVKPEALSIRRSEEHTSELQSLMRISYAVFCLKKKKNQLTQTEHLCHIH